jgi:hypothetical protein
VKIFGYRIYFHKNLNLTLSKKDGYVKKHTFKERFLYCLSIKLIPIPTWNDIDIWTHKVCMGYIK